MTKIKELVVNKIIDGNACFVVEAKAFLDNNMIIEASIPFANNSFGSQKEANEVVEQIQKNSKKIMAIKIDDDFVLDVDKVLIELKDKKISNQTTLLLSVLCSRIGARVNEVELYKYLNKVYGFNQKMFDLPIPLFNMFNGGIYGDTNLDFEEFILIPLGKSKTSFLEKVEKGVNIYHELSNVLEEAGYDTDVGTEGGYAPDINSSVQAIDLILFAVSKAGYVAGTDIGIGIDIGSTQLYSKQNDKYIFKLDEANFTSDNLIELYKEWARKYPLIYLEDCLAKEDKEGWKDLTNELRDEIIIAGDNFFSNDINTLRDGLKDHLANSVVVKLESFYTISEMVEYIKLAQKHNYKIIISHSYSETSDDFIADLAVACNANFIKSGSLARTERVAKYNRLIEIERGMV